MKLLRRVVLGVIALAAVVLIAAAFAFNSSFQTWAVRRALAQRPELGVTVGSVTAGWKRVQATQVRVERDGAVLTLPSVEADLATFSAVLHDELLVSRLIAKGWTLDLSKTKPATQTSVTTAPTRGSAATPPPSAISGGSASLASDAASNFAGIFSLLRLPHDLALDGVQLEGEVILPDGAGRGRVVLSGGGLVAGNEGKFELTSSATLTGGEVASLDFRATLRATMDTPRTFTRVAARIDAAAKGAPFPNGVKLIADLGATRGANGEEYSLSVAGETRPLVSVQAGLSRGARQVAGTWKLDLRDTDLAPFALGRLLPAFAAAGEGKFDLDASLSSPHVAGTLQATADRLAIFNPALTAVGPLKLTADFDLAERNGALAVQRLQATLAGAQPVATARALQPFSFNWKTRQLAATDAARELLGLVLEGLPLAWTQPVLNGHALSGGDLRGELAASARAGGMTVRSTGPLTANGVTLSRAGQPMVRGLDLSFQVSADYAPQGWLAEINGFTARAGATSLFGLDAKAGQLAGAQQPVKATGALTVNLAALSAQPVVAGVFALAEGDANMDFAASLGAQQELQAKVLVRHLVVDPKAPAEKLPAISADLRADIAADGRIALNAPILLEREGRKSDLLLTGTLAKIKDRFALDARVASANFVVADAKTLAAIMPASVVRPETSTPEKPVRDARPPWSAVQGTLALDLKKVIYSESFQANDVTGVLRIDEGALTFQKIQVGLNHGGSAQLEGRVTFDGATTQPYALRADLAVHGFDPGPLLATFNPGQPATVEGRFDVTSQVASRAGGLAGLPAAVTGNFELSSTEGIFRGLPVKYSAAAEKTGKLAAGAALLGSAIDRLKGRPESSDLTNYSQAMTEITTRLSAIKYDQLKVLVSRDASLNARLDELTLISPEIRLEGKGEVTHRAGGSVWEDALAMEFKLRARERAAEALKYIGALEPTADEFGYFGSTLPLKIGGSLGKPDATEATKHFANLLLEKAGLLEKASDALSRLLGGGK